MKNVNINELIEDYKNGMNIYDICEKYQIGKARAKDILKANDVALRKRGKQPLNADEFVVKDFRTKKFEEHEGYHYIARDRKNGFETKKVMKYNKNIEERKVNDANSPKKEKIRMSFIKQGKSNINYIIIYP